MMASSGLSEMVLGRIEEARVYADQGLKDGAIEVLRDLLAELEQVDGDDAEKVALRFRIESELEQFGEESEPSAPMPETEKSAEKSEEIHRMADPSQAFRYGMALMDGQFWEDAIRAFKQVAALGYHTMQCWELCGDCAALIEKWEEALRYYEIVYTQPDLAEDLKRQLLIKISKCSQNHKKTGVKSSLKARVEGPQSGEGDGARISSPEPRAESSSITSLDRFSINHLLGRNLHSWQDGKGRTLAGKARVYRLLNVLHVGISSLIVELEDDESGDRFAGQALSADFNRFLSPEALASWIRTQMMVDSPHLVRVFDLARCGDHFFIVREHLPLSLVELVSGGKAMPIPIATLLAYQILDGLGDLHLHMGRDEQIRNIYHLDLRPSRILLHDEKPLLKICNGGLWKKLEESNRTETAIKRLPLPFLAYRASEQFRTYLSRRKPPVFTDLYLFGALFYEMLTGIPAFSASSFEEYEIAHCEQYPTPPKVWRSEIPEELNSLIMRCLECDPMKRWRSATELSLILEKTLTQSITSTETREAYKKYIKRARAL